MSGIFPTHLFKYPIRSCKKTLDKDRKAFISFRQRVEAEIEELRELRSRPGSSEGR